VFCNAAVKARPGSSWLVVVVLIQPKPNTPTLTYTHTHTPTHTLNSVAHQRASTGCARHQQPKCHLCYHARPGLVAGERTRDLKREVRR
jgi:hypothetical protein